MKTEKHSETYAVSTASEYRRTEFEIRILENFLSMGL